MNKEVLTYNSCNFSVSLMLFQSKSLKDKRECSDAFMAHPYSGIKSSSNIMEGRPCELRGNDLQNDREKEKYRISLVGSMISFECGKVFK